MEINSWEKMHLTKLHDPASGILRVSGFMSGTGSKLVKIIEKEIELNSDGKIAPYHVAVIFTDNNKDNNALSLNVFPALIIFSISSSVNIFLNLEGITACSESVIL